MAASSFFSDDSSISYVEVYTRWLKSDRERNGEFTIPINNILLQLIIRKILVKFDYQLLTSEKTDDEKVLKLFVDHMPQKGEHGFNEVVEILVENKNVVLAHNLIMEKEKYMKMASLPAASPSFDEVQTQKASFPAAYPPYPSFNEAQTKKASFPAAYPPYPSFNEAQTKKAAYPLFDEAQTKKASFPATYPLFHETQTHLFRLIKNNVDFMAKYWSDVIPLAQTNAAFVDVQILEHFKSETGAPVHSYREMFEKYDSTVYRRILIQGDPGCGKTTYVSKLALDWAHQDEYLRETFDFIFLIAMQTLTTSINQTIKSFLPKHATQFFESYSNSCESKILLILDGFDELGENSEWYASVMNLLTGKSLQFQFFLVIVTTRRSHIDRIPQQFHERSLLINGFDQQSMKQFLVKQCVPLPTVGEQSNLVALLQNPLFCAIYCSLHCNAWDPIELEDDYDLIKALVENSVSNTIRIKSVFNAVEQLDEIGKFAFQMLGIPTIELVNKFSGNPHVVKPSFDLSSVDLDLLIKRKYPAAGINRFKEEYSFPHTLITEYLAVRYFARSLTEEQLKRADATQLLPFTRPNSTDLPFCRFLFFELFFLYLEKKYEKRAFDTFVNIPELALLWNCKSNRDISALDDISRLRFSSFSSEWLMQNRFVPTLSKCKNLSSLSLGRALSKNQVTQLVNFINNNSFAKLIELKLNWNENVGSTPQLFAVLSKCRYLEILKVSRCGLTVESANNLATCFDNNGFASLRKLNLSWNENVGSTTQLFAALHKCRQLQELNLDGCSLTNESLNVFFSTFNSSTYQRLSKISLVKNDDIQVDDTFLIALEKCPNILEVRLFEDVQCNLSVIGQKVKQTLKQRGCRFEWVVSVI